MSFSLTRKTDYALVALSALAKEKLADGEPLSARQISEAYELPLPLLMNALKELHRAGVVASRRGAGGGYFLSRSPDDITIRDVIEVMEGPISVTLCADEGSETHHCQMATFCPISDPMQRFNSMLNQFLSIVTLKTLATGEQACISPFPGVHV